jgi:hypothetical protein
MKGFYEALCWMLLGIGVGMAIGAMLNGRTRQSRERAESEAFWNSPYMMEQRREHEERLKKDPLYRMQWQEMEQRHDL